MRLRPYLRVQATVLVVALIGAGIVLATEFLLTQLFHVYYIFSTVAGLGLSFEWNINANILLKIIKVGE